jgi:hypothetical protein
MYGPARPGGPALENALLLEDALLGEIRSKGMLGIYGRHPGDRRPKMPFSSIDALKREIRSTGIYGMYGRDRRSIDRSEASAGQAEIRR